MPDNQADKSPALPLPLVSVVITNFNYGRYVAQAIRSIAAQSYLNFECVIVDDLSSDDSLQVIKHTLQELADRRFSLFRNPANTGQMGAMKAGLARASGKFIVFIDADDVLLPDFLTQQLVHLTAQIGLQFIAPDGMRRLDCNERLQFLDALSQWQLAQAGEYLVDGALRHVAPRVSLRHARQCQRLS